MSKTLAQVLVAAAVTVAVWLLGGRDWPLLIVGAVLSMSLWLMLFFGNLAGRDAGGPVSSRDFAVAAGIAIALGYFLTLIGDGPVWWAVGFIMAGALVPTAASAAQGRGTDER